LNPSVNKNFIITPQNTQEFVSKIGSFIKSCLESAGAKGVILGMSGGIDCSTVARICQSNGIYVKLVMLPDGSSMSIQNSMTDAMSLINKFNFEYKTIDISTACNQLERATEAELSDISRINIRPRIRMTTLYTIAQNEGLLVIGTGNLDERLLGYFTKWGDGASDLNPLGMLTKGEVRILARYLDVPKGIIDKPPSAALFEGQTDEADLGFTYDEIDRYILNGTTENPETDKKLETRITACSHKLQPIKIFENGESQQHGT